MLLYTKLCQCAAMFICMYQYLSMCCFAADAARSLQNNYRSDLSYHINKGTKNKK